MSYYKEDSNIMVRFSPAEFIIINILLRDYSNGLDTTIRDEDKNVLSNLKKKFNDLYYLGEKNDDEEDD